MRAKLALAVIIILGAFLRFYKLDWGEGFFFHPDEYHIAIAVNRLNFPENMNPELFSYGSFSIYLIYFSRLLLGFFNPDLSNLNPIIFGRFYSALFSTLTIFLVYSISSNIFKKKKFAFISSFITAMVPGLIQQAHFATPESTLTFWLFLTIALWLKWLERRKLRHLILSALSLGAGMATKIVAASYLPILIVMPFIGKPILKDDLVKKIKLLVAPIFLTLLSLSSFLIFFPYSVLDKSGFLHSMNYETSVAQGKLLVFYTRQFINTTPFVFQITKVFPYILGPAVFIFGVLGIVLAGTNLVNSFIKRKRIGKNILILLLSFFAYLIPNALLFAKWTRFMAPTIPFFCIFSVYTIYLLRSRKGFLSKYISPSLIIILITLTTVWEIMFFSIYKKPDVRLTATVWIKQNIPQNSTILTEEGNTLEVPLSGSFNKMVFNFYNLDNGGANAELSSKLFQSDYFIVQSRRVFINHQRLPSEFPNTSSFYDKLFSGESGFTKLMEFSSHPTLSLGKFKFEINDELAEETWSVFDHPVIRIYQKN